MKVKIYNQSRSTVILDREGLGRPEDKIVLGPRDTATTDLSDRMYVAISNSYKGVLRITKL